MHAMQTFAARPWWCEPWPWLLMAGPFVVIVGCGITIWLATSHPDAVIHDNVVQRGLVVEKAAAALATHTVHAEAQ